MLSPIGFLLLEVWRNIDGKKIEKVYSCLKEIIKVKKRNENITKDMIK